MTSLTIRAPASLAMPTIGLFAADLLAALAGTDDVALDLSDVTYPDLSVVQLVEAARRQADRDGVTLSLVQPATGPLAHVLDRAGFSGAAGDDHQFWFHGAIAR